MYAHLLGDNPDPSSLDKQLDEPLPSELTTEDRRVFEMRRVADANRAAIQTLGRGRVTG